MLEPSTSIRREHREKNLRISSLLRDRSTKENLLRLRSPISGEELRNSNLARKKLSLRKKELAREERP